MPQLLQFQKTEDIPIQGAVVEGRYMFLMHEQCSVEKVTFHEYVSARGKPVSKYVLKNQARALSSL